MNEPRVPRVSDLERARKWLGKWFDESHAAAGLVLPESLAAEFDEVREECVKDAEARAGRLRGVLEQAMKHAPTHASQGCGYGSNLHCSCWIGDARAALADSDGAAAEETK